MSNGKKYRVVIELPKDSPYLVDIDDYYRRLDGFNGFLKVKRGSEAGPLSTEVLLGYFTGGDLTRAMSNVLPGVFYRRSYSYRSMTKEDGIVIEFYDHVLTESEHRQFLRLSNRGISKERRGKLSNVMKELGNTIMRVEDSRGNLIEYAYEPEFMLRCWGYDVDETNAIISFHFPFSDTDRADYLSASIAKDEIPNRLKSVMRQELVDIERLTARRAIPMPHTEWRIIFKLARERLEEQDHDYKATAHVLRLIRRQFGSESTDGLRAYVEGSMRRLGKAKLQLSNGEETDVPHLLALVSRGYRDAVRLMADVLVEGYEERHGTPATGSQTNKRASSNNHDDNLPEWARPEKTFVEVWAERTLASHQEGKAGCLGRYLAEQVGKHRLTVLVFDSLLYEEVVSAELTGLPSDEVISFPFPIAIIRTPSVEGVYGVAILAREELRESFGAVEASWFEGNGYEVAYVLNSEGVTLLPEATVARMGEKLITYLDCDNAMLDTIIVDGITSDRRNSGHVVAGSRDEESYVTGSTFDVGTRIIVERDHTENKVDAITRRAHFRRGFFKRQRIGPRDDWHYEERWVKPTFVHGSTLKNTERKVKKIIF